MVDLSTTAYSTMKPYLKSGRNFRALLINEIRPVVRDDGKKCGVDLVLDDPTFSCGPDNEPGVLGISQRWVDEQHPKVGGYIVIDEKGNKVFTTSGSFKKDYSVRLAV